MTVDAMPPAYDSVIDGIRAGIRQAKGAALSGADITDATPFWFSPDAERPSLSFDSLDFLELVVFLEEEFGWYVPEEQIDVNECRTIGDLAALPAATLVDALGRAHGQQLHQLAQGRDERPVEPDRETKSIGQEETFPRDVADRETLRREALRMAERVGTRLRDHGFAGRTVVLKVRFPDFRTITRSRTLATATDLAADIGTTARALLDAVDVAEGVRLLGVSVQQLADPHDGEQQALALDLDAPAVAA